MIRMEVNTTEGMNYGSELLSWCSYRAFAERFDAQVEVTSSANLIRRLCHVLAHIHQIYDSGCMIMVSLE